MRFIGELAKFKMFSKTDTLHCLKVSAFKTAYFKQKQNHFFPHCSNVTHACGLQMLLSDFSHHHIEMACTLLETCGRFLFRSPDSHLRTSVLLVSTHATARVVALIIVLP